VIYEWDPKKAAANLKKHKVSFAEGTTVFTDPSALTFDDPDHSLTEKRFLAHADRGDDCIRIISARRTTKSEAHAYQEARNP
jgi:uncharacterized DUF497 family protein